MQELLSFMAQYDDEAKCRQFLFQIRWPNGFVCTRCGNDEYCFIYSRNLYQCMMCRHQVSLTSGTMFHSTKLPISYWLFVFHWFTAGHDCSARKLSVLLQVHYRTALRMINIVRQTMKAWTGGNPIMIGDNRWEITEVKQCERSASPTEAEPTTVEMGTIEPVAADLVAAEPLDAIRNDESVAISDKCTACGAVLGRDFKEGLSSAEESNKVAADAVAGNRSGVVAVCEGNLERDESAAANDALLSVPAKERSLAERVGHDGDVRRPRLLKAYRSDIVAEALRIAQNRMKQHMSALYRHVRNWQRYDDEYHYRMAATGMKNGAAVSLLDVATAGYFYYAG